MRRIFLAALLFVGMVFLLVPEALAQATLSPLNPIATPGGSTITFTVSGSVGTSPVWSCANTSNGGACKGSFNAATQVYTPPASLIAKQSVGGYALLPDDHIYNTRVDGLALRSDSATLIAGAGTVPVNFLASFPLNYTNGATPTDTLIFHYTPAANGSFQSPQWPVANIENGWFDALMAASNIDHHLITEDVTNGNLAERYQYFAQAPVTTCTVNGANSATCTITATNTSPGFARAAAVGSTVQVGSFTGGDTYLNGVFTLTAATATSITFNITHAAASTSTTGQATLETGTGNACDIAGTCNSQSGAKYTYASYALPTPTTDAAGMLLEPLTLHTQELVNACVNGTTIQHALRMTLQNGYLHPALLWPATADANAGAGVNFYGERVRLKSSFVITGFSTCAQVVLTAFKNYGLFIADGGAGWQVNFDWDNTPAAEVAVLKEINAAAIATSNWEVPDESGLMETASSGAANNGEVITYTSSTGTVKTHVALAGTAVDVNTNQFYIMAGTPAQQLVTYSGTGAVTCTMSPAVGTLTSGCLYTAPASVTVGTKSTTTVTIASSANAAVVRTMLIYVFPATNLNITQDTADFTDSHGAVWFSGGAYGFGMSNVPSWQGCCQNDATIAGTDKQLFWNRLYSSLASGDYKVDFHVPAGSYQVVFNNGTSLAAGADVRYFYAQGVLVNTVDSTAAAGAQNAQWSFTQNVTVGSNNTLSFYNAGIGKQTNNSGDISSISLKQLVVNQTPFSPNRRSILFLTRATTSSEEELYGH